jgi:hypothetical protein
MTTKQITDNNAHDTESPDDALNRASEAQAEDASRQLLAKARYDAFRLMTEARDEAETILDEARAEAEGTKKAAALRSASDIDAAEARAAEIVEAAHEEAASIVASAHRTAGDQDETENAEALEAEHKALSERVSTLKTLADQLENRFAALAATASAEPSPNAQDEGPTTNSAIDYSASVAPPSKQADGQASSAPAEERDSFYHRRSAKLPRLGEDSGRGIFDLSRALRSSLESD